MYGTFVPFFIATCYVQWVKFSERGNINRLMASATAFFGLSVTANLVISLVQAMRAILANSSGAAIHLPTGASTSILGIARFVVFQFQVVVAAVIIVYRMYHIYDRNPFMCVLPSLTIAASFAAGCGVVGQLRDPAATLRSLLNWSTATFTLTVFNSLFLTASISFRLWRVHRTTKGACIQVENSIILRAIKVLIESAALWTSFATMNFLAYLAKSNLSYTFLAMSSPAVGISFCLIIVRLGDVVPVARDDTWDVSVHNQASRTGGSGRIAVSFPKVKVQQDVYVSESEDFPTRASEAQERGCVDASVSLPKISRSSPSVSTLM